MPLGACLAAFAAGLVLVSSVAAAQDTPAGIFVGTPDGPQEVGAYLSRTVTGRPRSGVGTLDEAPIVPGVVRVLCNLPHWRMRAVWLSTAKIMRDDRAERRVLKFRTRQLSVTGMFIQVVATEDPAQFKRLLDDVGATEDNAAYLFVTMESSGAIRDYVIGVPLEPE